MSPAAVDRRFRKLSGLYQFASTLKDFRLDKEAELSNQRFGGDAPEKEHRASPARSPTPGETTSTSSPSSWKR